jgi:hypothetical protein
MYSIISKSMKVDQKILTKATATMTSKVAKLGPCKAAVTFPSLGGPRSSKAQRVFSTVAKQAPAARHVTTCVEASASEMPPMPLKHSVPVANELGQELFQGPAVWTGEDLKNSEWWGHMLSKENIDDIHQATEACKARGAVQWLHQGVPDIIAKEDFPLGPGMVQKLANLSAELEDGKGLAMIANFPVADPRFTEDDLAVAYLGVSAHIGHIVLQSSSGLRSVTRGYGLPMGRIQAEMTGETPKDGKQTNNHFRYHTDRSDVISLLSIRTAPTGGYSRVASAPAIYNAMMERCPELAKALTQPIDRIWEGENGFFRLPVWGMTPAGKFTTQFSPSYVENAQFLENTIKATPMQIKALDAIESIGMEIGAEYKAKPGTMYFLNNHQVYHGRGNWTVTDKEAEGAWGNAGRLLLRTWISPFNSRDLPDTEQYRFVYGSVKGGTLRGGYDQAVTTGEVPKPKMPEDHEYYSLYDREVQQHSMHGRANTFLE